MNKSSLAIVRRGRPSKLNDAIVQKIVSMLKDGLTVTEACNLSGISRETFYSWMKTRPAFSDEIVAAKQWLLAKARHNIAKAINSGDLKVSAWYVEKNGKADDDYYCDIDGASRVDKLSEQLAEISKKIIEAETG